MTSFAFRTALSEDSGSRSGLALSESDLLAHLPAQHPMREGLEQNIMMRVASDTYADTVGDLLFALGATKEPGMPTIGIRLMRLLDQDRRSIFSLEELMKLEAVARHYLHLRNEGQGGQAEILAELKCMADGKQGVFDALVEAMTYELAYSPFYTRDFANVDKVTLDSLFTSEQLPANEEHYFDQRFINYLGSQPEKLKDIHWRQFEGLTAEWFMRSGYDVALGPGRNDGSIDVRLWNGDAEPGIPPAIIVQCKRQKRKVERVVVKALYADMLAEGVGKGMVVTTSDISPGAASDVKARSYPITTANRAQVHAWIEAMRKPDAGIVGDIFS